MRVSEDFLEFFSIIIRLIRYRNPLTALIPNSEFLRGDRC